MDDRHPVANLIKGDGFRKWLSHPQEKSGQIEAVFQLEQPCIISYIDIGSIWCATLEIKVGCSDWPAGREFDTLAYTVNLMTPADSITGKNPNKTQMFSADLFCPEIAKKKWDRLKVICRQPYKKLTQFGLSFLRVKTSSSTTNSTPVEKKENVLASSTVKDIQNHFMQKLDNGLNQSNGQLKSRLLKIAASSENGIEHDESLSRTAKLVLAASGNKPKSYMTQSPVPNQEKSSMYSSRVDQKYAPKFEEELDEFLKQLVIDPKELDSITMADLRHRFERKKRRKLTKDEKKIFIQKATEHLTSVFTDKTNQSIDKGRLDKTHPTNVVDKNIDKMKSTAITKNTENGLQKQPDIKKTGVKRKLESGSGTPPSKKVITEKKNSPLTVMQKLKSSENQSNLERKDLIGQLKKAKQTGPIVDCVSSPGTPFQYKGLRGRESDIDSQLSQGPVSPCSTFSSVKNQNVSWTGKDTMPMDHNMMDCQSSVDECSPLVEKTIISDSSDEDDWFNTEVKVTKERKGRGRGRGRGRGQGRGRGKQSSTPASKSNTSDIDLSSDICTPTRGRRGRGRGRGKSRGRGGAEVRTQVCHDDNVVTKEEMAAPRGFTKCSGCGDYFGDALLNAHEQRCAALKSKSKSNVVADSNGMNTPVNTCKRPSASSLEVRPTSFNRCEGCNEYFGEPQMSIHYQNCVPWKNKNNTSACDSPWLSTRSPNHTVGSGQKLESSSSLGTSQEVGQGSKGDQTQIRSPPWLLAAERRLQQQKNSTSSEQSMSNSPSDCRNNSINLTSDTSPGNWSLGANNVLSSPPSSVIDSQQYMYEKYNSQRNCVDSQDSESQSILQDSTPACVRKISKSSSANVASGRAKSKGGNSKGKNKRQSTGIAMQRFSAIELSDDSDDDINIPNNKGKSLDRGGNTSDVSRGNGASGVDRAKNASGVDRAKNASGGIKTNNASGVVRAKNASGGIRTNNASGGSRADNTNAFVRVNNASGVAKANDASDGVRTNNTNGGINAANNVPADIDLGGIQVECPLCGNYFPSYIIEAHASTCYL